MKRRFLLLLAAVAIAATASILLSVSLLTFDSQGAVGFGASVNTTAITQSQTVRVYLKDWNTLDFKNSLPLSDGLRTLNLSSGPCGGLYPGGIALYQGAYDLSNASSAAPLMFYAPGFYSCHAALITNSFTFKPLQNVTTHVDLVGYWTSGSTPQPDGGSSDGVLHPFLPGVYTVIVGDEWGNTGVMYFHVNGTTGNLERTGPISNFPASWLDPCNQSATGNVTTLANLDLNASSDFNHISLSQVYGQIVNSSSFAYRSVGHGWVVSGWYEIEGSGSNVGGVDQVIVSFILTSDGVPSGYVYAHYDLPSGPVAITFTTALVASCST